MGAFVLSPTHFSFHDKKTCRDKLLPKLNAATELGLLLVKSFEENDREVDEARLSQLKRVAVAMTPGVEMSEFLKRAIRCASGGGVGACGSGGNAFWSSFSSLSSFVHDVASGETYIVCLHSPTITEGHKNARPSRRWKSECLS